MTLVNWYRLVTACLIGGILLGGNCIALSHEQGLALTPPMGWNSAGGFGCQVTDVNVRAQVDALVSSGMKMAGYAYINIDDCWAGTRDEKGFIHPNERFPDMKALGEYIHSKGLKFGIYSSPEVKTCTNFAGSFGHEEQDAQTYSDWGVDFLKYDNCNAKADLGYVMTSYLKMYKAIQKTGRPIVYLLCLSTEMDRVWRWGASVGGNLWRTTEDLENNWDSMALVGFGQNGLERFARPGHWNDPDMLYIGVRPGFPAGNSKGMKIEEYRVQMSLWCLLAAPLIVSNDLTKMTSEELAILINPEVVAVDQDPAGIQGRRVAQEGPLEVWMKPLADGSKVVGLFNRGYYSANPVTVYFNDIEMAETATVRDLWVRKDLGAFTNSFTATVPSHGVVMIKVK